MTSDQMIDLMRDVVIMTALEVQDGIQDRRAILGKLSVEDLGAVLQFLASFKTGALYPTQPFDHPRTYNVRGDRVVQDDEARE